MGTPLIGPIARLAPVGAPLLSITDSAWLRPPVPLISLVPLTPLVPLVSVFITVVLEPPSRILPRIVPCQLI